MVLQRFFIGNLPLATTEKDISKSFQDYGEISGIELKEKENLVDPGNVKKLAFVSLNIFDNDVDYCLRKLNSKPINGEYVRVSVAKESFLERLKRERLENAIGSKTAEIVHTAHEKDAHPILNKSKKFFNDDEDVNDKTFEDLFEDYDVLITKKKASNSIRNGKIVIESTNSAPLHVIGSKQKDVKHLSGKSVDSDNKRKESVKKKKNQYQLQKSLIQKSLSSMDAFKAKKIVFEDEENTSSHTKLLFEDSDEENDSFVNDFLVKSEYDGSHGAALMKLQSKINLDSRFKVDHKFVEKSEAQPVKNENSERAWQYGILEQVVGRKVSNDFQPKGNDKSQVKMLRYDPSKDNQDEFMIKSTTVQAMNEEDAAPVTTEKKEVSKEVFYMVSDNLTNSLKTRGDGFSLLSMFGNRQDDDGRTVNRHSKEKILVSKNDKDATLNPFSYDSSESENEQDIYNQNVNADFNKNAEGNNKTQTKLFVESFFIPRNDVRLKEGKLFFRDKARSGKTENYDEIKDKLKAMINTKINKTKRQLKITTKKRPIRGR